MIEGPFIFGEKMGRLLLFTLLLVFALTSFAQEKSPLTVDFYGPTALLTAFGETANVYLTEFTAPPENQRALANIQRALEDESDLIKIPELSRLASTEAQDINTKLKAAGLNIELEDIGDHDIHSVAILDVAFEWMARGKDTKIHAYDLKDKSLGFNLDGFKIDSEANEITIGVLNSRAVVRIPTKKGYEVLLHIPVTAPADESELEKTALAMARAGGDGPRYKGHLVPAVSIPKLNLDVKRDVSWLKGMSFGGYVVYTALSQMKFKLDNIGGKLVVGTAASGAKGIGSDGTYLFDMPFVLTICKTGSNAPRKPLFSMFVEMEHMQKSQE